MIQVFTEKNFRVDFIWLKSKASTKFSRGFIFLDGKLRQILRRLVFAYYAKSWYYHLTCSYSNLIKKWFNSCNQITLEHVKHNKLLYQYHGIIIPNEIYFFVFKIFIVSLFEHTQVTRWKSRSTSFNQIISKLSLPSLNHLLF